MVDLDHGRDSSSFASGLTEKGQRMNLSVNVPPSLEDVLKTQASAAGKDVETFVLETLEQALGQSTQQPLKLALTHEQFREKLQHMIDLHPGGNSSMDDSRESIYSGRGE